MIPEKLEIHTHRDRDVRSRPTIFTGHVTTQQSLKGSFGSQTTTTRSLVLGPSTSEDSTFMSLDSDTSSLTGSFESDDESPRTQTRIEGGNGVHQGQRRSRGRTPGRDNEVTSSTSSITNNNENGHKTGGDFRFPVIAAAAGFLAAGPLGLLIGGAAGAATAGIKEMSPKRKHEIMGEVADVKEKLRDTFTTCNPSPKKVRRFTVSGYARNSFCALMPFVSSLYPTPTPLSHCFFFLTTTLPTPQSFSTNFTSRSFQCADSAPAPPNTPIRNTTGPRHSRRKSNTSTSIQSIQEAFSKCATTQYSTPPSPLYACKDVNYACKDVNTPNPPLSLSPSLSTPVNYSAVDDNLVRKAFESASIAAMTHTTGSASSTREREGLGTNAKIDVEAGPGLSMGEVSEGSQSLVTTPQ